MPTVKLPFGDVLSESFGFFFARLGLFFHLVTIPWIVSLGLRVANALLGGETPVAALVEKAADTIPTVMFMVAWTRVALLGPGAVQRLPGLGWSMRETLYLLHLIQVAGMTYALIAAFSLVMGPIDLEMLRQGAPPDPDTLRRQALALPIGSGFMVSALLALRVCFGLAASAVDLPFSPRHSWAFSRGNGWAIVGIFVLILLTGFIATLMALLLPLSLIQGVLGASTAAEVVAWAAAILASYGSVALVATAEAIIFSRLTGWRPGAAAPVLPT